MVRFQIKFNYKNILSCTNYISNKLSEIILSLISCLILISTLNDVKYSLFSNKIERNFFKECGMYINSQIMIDLTGANKREFKKQENEFRGINIKPMGFAFNPFEDFLNLMMNDIRQFEHDPLFDVVDDDEEILSDKKMDKDKRRLNNAPARNNKKPGKLNLIFYTKLIISY